MLSPTSPETQDLSSTITAKSVVSQTPIIDSAIISAASSGIGLFNSESYSAMFDKAWDTRKGAVGFLKP